MKSNKKFYAGLLLVCTGVSILLSACFQEQTTQPQGGSTNERGTSRKEEVKVQPAPAADGKNTKKEKQDRDSLPVVADPDVVTVMVNKQNRLPENYSPDDLVYPNVRFLFDEKIEKRMLRKEAAKALEDLFAAAEKDGIYLAGVSGYRSEERQKVIFNQYVAKDGEEKAKTYSAYPGTSEHQTGLAIDVSGTDGSCAAESCFAGTPEAEWLAAHAADFGFIIRYPEGKEKITGYKYEPWHLRYVGIDLAKEVSTQGITLEEYFGEVLPVTTQP
ncbi:M15 family metallopeptidase [Paenibacillus sp. P96]|uniref:M15 family metallopeptidase n=1 Tax=Paenibacillus zeirhizosphaerae TaxID=2987519 RepID=A0ABT9FR44_9BACL|nr:M15 family metallopeptidase [Paenibacillus sp. P96]MDP4097187.1 M15 family metallopeptidase [Paenibacillus sp. P96]